MCNEIRCRHCFTPISRGEECSCDGAEVDRLNAEPWAILAHVRDPIGCARMMADDKSEAEAMARAHGESRMEKLPPLGPSMMRAIRY